MLCTESSSAETVAAWIIQVGVIALFVALFRHARSEGRRWVSTLLSGALFGWAAEFMIVNGARCPVGYDYVCSPLVPTLLGIPVIVGVGWGAILYACTWTAQRMQLPPLLRPAVAGLLAVNLDLSLDPVATKLRFWTWYETNGTWVRPLDPATHEMSLYYQVPYDNFLGWFLIVASYTWAVRLLFRIFDRKGHAQPEPSAPASREWRGSESGRYGLAPDLADAMIPLAAVALALGFLRLLKLEFVQEKLSTIPPSVIFVVALPVAVMTSWIFACKSNRHHPIQWPVIIIPLFFHGYAVLVLLAFVFFGIAGYEFDSLIVATSFNTVAGFVAFAWPSLATLFPTRQEEALRRGTLVPTRDSENAYGE